MCGIAGLFVPGGPPDTALERMNDCQRHRGPDCAGVYSDAPVGLAHRRLAIIDPDGGAQPLSNENGSVVVVFNGELYNHRRIRERLAGDHRFETDTDTEVIVHLYEERGVDLLDDIEGMFAFALWDGDRKRLLLARDRVGIKPILLARDGDRVAFASEMPALLAAAEDDAVSLGGLDRTALTQYLGFGHVPAPRTAFENVRRVRPGERVVVSTDGVTSERYWRPSVTPQDPGLDVAASEIRHRVEGAVERRLMSDEPLGAFLSGGLDSSIVVGTMASLRDDPVSTFTVGFEEERFDERWAAREVANRNDTDHHEYTVTPEDVREAVPAVLDRLGEPFADPSLVPTHVVARETSRDVTVALSGDGADELFGGYDRYWGEHLSSYYRAVPATVRQGLEGVVDSVSVDRTSRVGELTRKAQTFARGGEPDIARRHFEWARRPGDTAAGATTPEVVDEGVRLLRDQHTGVEEWLPDTRCDDLTRVQAVETRHGLPDQILHKSDLAGMFNSLEVRVPFLDTEILEYAFSLPRSYKLTTRSRKRVLREAFSDVLPGRVEQRGKQGFDMPVGEWLSGPLERGFREAVGELDGELLDPAATVNLLAAHRNGRADHSGFLWAAYVYARWRGRMDERGVL